MVSLLNWYESSIHSGFGAALPRRGSQKWTKRPRTGVFMTSSQIVPQRSVCKQKRHAPLPWVTQGTLPHYSSSSSPTKRPDRFKIQNQGRVNETQLLPPKSCPFSPFRFFIYEQSKNYKYFVKGKVTIRNRKSEGIILSKTRTVSTSIFTKF